MQERLRKLIKILEKDNLDALLISHQPNISYLTRYNSRDSHLLVSPKDAVFITDFRYLQEAKEELKGFSIEKINGSRLETIASLIKNMRWAKIGFEARHLDYGTYQNLKKYLKTNAVLFPVINKLESLRQIKDKDEIDNIRKAVKIAGSAFNRARKIIRPGIKEIEVASEIEYFVKTNFSCGMSFDMIVGFGRNASLPHYITSERKLKQNEVVLIDLGVDFKGYKSDLTRVFFLGKIPFTAKKIYDIVLAAQERAIAKIKPGAFINSIDREARQFIAERGYGSYFGHSLGHGIGLEVHESPYINKKNNQRLEAGMVFTVEPGIYIPGKFGIRIEDIVSVTKKGCEIISGDINKSI